MTRPSWKNPRVLTTLLLVFATGAVAGALTMRFGIQPERHKTMPYWNEGGKEITLQKFKKELNLTPQQASEIELVLDDFVSYWQMLEAQFKDVRATGKKRIIRILNEEQRQKFERMLSDTRLAGR